MEFLKSVVIVGSHTRTRGFIPWNRPNTDYWVFNEAACQGWPENVNGVFQMHAPAVWKNPLNRNDERYPQWMKRRHRFPVYMQDRYEEVPASVQYPIDELCAELLPGLTKGGAPVRPFTSSVGFAIALAIFQGYKRIDLYGIEMESDTEYRYQRDGVFFWIGIAVGRGIDVAVHQESSFFSEPVYGYEGDVELTFDFMRAREQLLSDRLSESKQKVENANQLHERALEQAMDESGGDAALVEEATRRRFFASIRQQAQAFIEAGMFDGATTEIKRYIHKAEQMEQAAGNHIFARQEFEINARATAEQKNAYQAAMNVAGAEANSAWRALSAAIEQDLGDIEIRKKAKAFADLHEKYLKSCFDFGIAAGITQENLYLLDQVDRLIKAAGGEKAAEALILGAVENQPGIRALSTTRNQPESAGNGHRTKRGRRKAAAKQLQEA